MYEYKRGDIFYIANNYKEVGSEQFAGRPAIIVSNDLNNKNSDVVEIVYLTTKSKTELPTHIDIKSSSKPSIALCEQIYSLSKERIGDYVGTCSETEMKLIDTALLISLGIEVPEAKVTEKPEIKEEQKEAAPVVQKERVYKSNELVIKLSAELGVYKELYKELLTKSVG